MLEESREWRHLEVGCAHQHQRPQLGQLEEAGEKAIEKLLPRPLWWL